jgi:phosphoadenosine phosphosulfate reductase
MLQEQQLDGLVYNKVEKALARIRYMAPIAEKRYGGYVVCISGGKDSTVITDLAIKAGVKIKSFDVNWTGIEYPETVYFLRMERRRLEAMGYTVNFLKALDKEGKRITMWKLIEDHGLPSRFRRFCCGVLKEAGHRNCYSILGIRWAESTMRKKRGLHEVRAAKVENRIVLNNDNTMKRRMAESCLAKRSLILNPIIEWSDEDVWDFIKKYRLPYNPLYDQGHKRVGCIGCPMVKNRPELEANPRWAALYKRVAQKYLEGLNGTGLARMFKMGEDYYAWWLCRCDSDKRRGEHTGDQYFPDESFGF